jgi:hypothetical protein
MMQWLRRFGTTKLKKHWAELLDDDKREKEFLKLKEETGTDLSAMTREDIQGMLDGTRFKVDWKIPKENWLKDNLELLPLIFQPLQRMHWRLYYAGRNTAFITSDNPVGVVLKESDGYARPASVFSPRTPLGYFRSPVKLASP